MLSIGINSKSEQRSVQSVAKSFRSV